MENLIGLLKVRVVRGVNLVNRDVRGSDPYVILRMGDQRLKTGVKKNNVNPEWNDDLTLAVSEPIQPIKLEVYDKDSFSSDDKMGDAELDIQLFLKAARIDWEGHRSGTIVRTMEPSEENCIAKESNIVWKDGRVMQDIVLKLRNVDNGEVELQLQWVNAAAGSGSS